MMVASAAGLLLAVTPCAHGQGLDLGPSVREPSPGDGLAVLALADRLDEEAEGAPERDPSGAIRRLAAELLRGGEYAGGAGGEAVLAGLTLARSRAELDALLDSADGSTRAYVASVLDGTEVSLLPREIDLLLRDALAPLAAQPDQGCGWFVVDADSPVERLVEYLDALGELQDNRRLTGDASTALDEMLVLLSLALDEPTHTRDAASWAELLVSASRALDEPPDWLDMPARDRLRDDFSTGLAMCLTEPDESRAHLGRTASLARIVHETHALADALQSRELRGAVSQLVAAAEGDPKREPETFARIAAVYERALSLIELAPPPPGSLARQVRPMLTPLTRSHGLAAAAVVRLLPRILAEPDPMTDPGVLAAMGSLAGVSEDLAIPARLSSVLTAWDADPAFPAPIPTREPVATRETGPLAERIRQLGVAMADEEEYDAALAQLRELAELAPLAMQPPGEAELRAESGSGVWRRVSGDQADRLLFLMSQARAEWLRSAGARGLEASRGEDSRQVRALAAALRAIRDAAAVETIRFDWARGRAPTINHWPGVELTRASFDALSEGLAERTARLAALAARGDQDQAVLGQAEELQREFAAAILLGRLELEHAGLGAERCGSAAELGSGVAGVDAWRSMDRAALAGLCRSAFEAAAAEDDQRASFLAHANRLADQLLSDWD